MDIKSKLTLSDVSLTLMFPNRNFFQNNNVELYLVSVFVKNNLKWFQCPPEIPQIQYQSKAYKDTTSIQKEEKNWDI